MLYYTWQVNLFKPHHQKGLEKFRTITSIILVWHDALDVLEKYKNLEMTKKKYKRQEN